MKKIILLLILVLLIAGCSEDKKEEKMEEKPYVAEQPIDISLRTEDANLIKAKYYPNSESEKGVVLIHQLSKDKSSYYPWATTFQKTHNTLIIDLRGHGESSGNWQEFTEKDFNLMIQDVQAATEFLQRKDISSISYVGASIGANTVQNFVSTNSFDKAVLLSPGKNYKGIELNLSDNGLLVVVSSEDSYSYNSVKELEGTTSQNKYLYLENKGHGTNMLDEELVQQIIEFLNK